MTAVRMWARSELRGRWRSWALLGVLAGATFGLVAAGVAGARRTADAVPTFVAVSHAPDAAVLANDPAFDEQERAAVAALPEVTRTYPFLVGFGISVLTPAGLGDASARLFPVTPPSARLMVGALVDGREPNPARADEVAVDENTRDKYGLALGTTMVVGQTAESLGAVPPDFLPTGVKTEFRQALRVVGITKSVSSDFNWVPSGGFYAKYANRMPGVVNLFVGLRHREADVARLQSDVERIAGHPVNVEGASDLFGIRKATNLTNVERDGLLLFALAALLAGGVLVGQALVRTVVAGAAEFPTWRAMGADRSMAVQALVLPAALTAVVASMVTVVVAIALSPRFPIGIARRFDIDVGIHADWLVLGIALLAVFGLVLLTATLAARWRVTIGERGSEAPSTAGRWAAHLGWSPALVVGSRLAVEPGRGRRAVPVRSALIGAVVGVVGVVACFTFRAGIEDAIGTPQRSGVVWNFGVATDGPLPDKTVTAVAADPGVAAVLRAGWHRAVLVNGTSVPVFGSTAIKGTMPVTVLDGQLPQGNDEIAFAPATMRELRLSVGDRVRVGPRNDPATVVGEVLLPTTSHTEYDQSGLMTSAGLSPALKGTDDDVEDYLLVRWEPGTNIAAAERRLTRISGPAIFAEAAQLPVAVVDLGRLASLPLALGVFFALLACATVAHALVTTVRRRRRDFAVLRSIGFTRRQSRLAIAWQATLLAAVGLLIGVPLGIATGRAVWRWLANEFPVVYVPPLALIAVVLVVPIAVALANMLAAGPAHAAARIRPAETLRTE